MFVRKVVRRAFRFSEGVGTNVGRAPVRFEGVEENWRVMAGKR